MKRTRRTTYGTMNGRQRKRAMRILRRLADREGTALYTQSSFRAARRLAEAGMLVAVASKVSAWRFPPLREVTLFPTLAAALSRYPKRAVMPGRRP